MNLTHIDIFSVGVTDQEAAKAFYTEKLGFRVVRDDPFGNQRWIQVAPPNGQTSITLVTDVMPPGAQQGIVLVTSDVRADHAALKANGVAISDIQDAP